jgi:hypothetical protein
MNILQYYYNEKLVSLNNNIYIIPKKEIKKRPESVHWTWREKKVSSPFTWSPHGVYVEFMWSYVEYVESK